MTTQQLDVLADEVYPPAWRPSLRGNLTRRLGRLQLTVYRHGRQWRWAITDVDTEEVRYAPRLYPSEDAAIGAVLAAARSEA